ncbi:T9SS type A sorting domain-containing protein [Robertkochia aurantiaca]|uniref:T9SS type A sorting domain-containing protein n=1 Tax=Robertkochia aurantiaca TaxID=2873700 RepID=UPI001CC93321|nr:T9SS type A sorting domain-containing protein [Robertkochia sp. 3YJGBD-33]
MEYRLLLQNPTQGSSDLVKVYPNPVNRKDNLNIALSGTGKKEIAFYDITGKMVKRLSTEKNSMTMNVSDLGAGVYILNVKSDSIQITKKVIIR